MKKSMFLYQNKILKVLLFLFITLIFISCQENKQSSFFTKINIKIPIDGVKNINDCAKWYVDFSRIKRAVIYKDRIICCGWNGGFACLNVYNFKRDVVLENKMNTDFYTNIAVFQDTLFTEKFDKLYYWNADTWVEYLNPLPIRYFDILYEDDTYVFQNYSMGEWGDNLFVYNKKTHVTRGALIYEPYTVFKSDMGYFLGMVSYGYSEIHIIKDVEKLAFVPDSIRLKEDTYGDFFPDYFHEYHDEFMDNRIPFDFYYKNIKINQFDGIRDSISFFSTFISKGKMYHFARILIKKGNHSRYFGSVIAKIEKDTVRIIDTLEHFEADRAYQFGNATILQKQYFENGFTIIRNDSIFNIKIISYHSNYKGKDINDSKYPPRIMKNLTHDIKFKLNINEENDYKAKKGQPEREIEFIFNNKYKIIGHEGNGVDGIYIEIDNKRNKLQLMSQRSFLYNIFVYDNRLFLNFARNIGIIEVTNIEKFVEKYKL